MSEIRYCFHCGASQISKPRDEMLCALGREIRSELLRIRQRYPDFTSRYDGLGVVKESEERLSRDVYFHGFPEERNRRMRKRALKLAAVAIRFIEDVCDRGLKR